MENSKVVLFDTETTGNQSNDRIIQAASIVCEESLLIDTVVESLCQSSEEICVEAMEVHGIVPDDLHEKPYYSDTEFAEVFNKFNHENNYLVAHNIKFDKGMIEKEGIDVKYTLIDTLKCARVLIPDSPSHRLSYLRYSRELYQREKETFKDLKITAHDALSDVAVMLLLLEDLLIIVAGVEPNKEPYKALVDITNTPIIADNFPFGKYKGEKISKIARTDRRYIDWMTSNLDLDEDLLASIEEFAK